MSPDPARPTAGPTAATYAPPARPKIVPDSPEPELAATGYAQVLVVLEPDTLTASAAAATTSSTSRRGRRGGAASHESTAAAAAAPSASGLPADLEQCFVTPPTAQDAALAEARVHSAARRLRRSLAAGASTEEAVERVAATVSAEVPKVRVYENLGVVLGTIDPSGLEGLRTDPRVREVHSAPQISLIRPTRVAASKKTSGVTYGIDLLGVPALWRAKFTGKGILVGHLDTGVDASHPALKKAVAAFAEFDFLGKEVPNAKARDSGQHGTHTAGTIAARKVGTTSFGVAPDAKLASAIVIEGGNVIARILAGMNWAVGQGVRILSMSLGLRGYTPAFLTLTRILRARNVLPVFAVGNEGPGTSRSPGNYAEALSIGACDSGSMVADFSGSQTFTRPNDPGVPDIVGPGVDVLSCIPAGKYAEMSGTSMATPHIAGLAALLMQASPNATIDDIEKAILGSAVLPAGMPAARGNHGLPSGPRAYQLLTGTALSEEEGSTKKRVAAGGRSARKTSGKRSRKRGSSKRRGTKRSTTRSRAATKRRKR